MPVRKRFERFEDPHRYYRILVCRKLSSDKEVDAAFKRANWIFKRIARKSCLDKLSGIPDKQNVEKLKEKYEWAHNAYKKCQRAYEILGDV